MTQKERLVDILMSMPYGQSSYEEFSEYLLSNGVFAPPVKLWQTVWVYIQSSGKIFQAKVVSIKVRGETPYKKSIGVEHTNELGETYYKKFTWAQIGKQVFFTKKEAERAFAERNTK